MESHCEGDGGVDRREMKRHCVRGMGGMERDGEGWRGLEGDGEASRGIARGMEGDGERWRGMARDQMTGA